MKLVLTILARDEADILDANLAYHLNRGVDFIVATDNNSSDETIGIFEEYERMGYLHLIREPGEDYAQSAWVSRMAHLAATEFHADWIMHGDADEFWWPREGSLKDILASIPEQYGVFYAHRLDFIPRPVEDGFFADRMVVRTQFPDKMTVAHRGDPDVVVGQGNHRLDETSMAVAPPWYGIDVLHFPHRSYSQFERKIVVGGRTGVKHWRNAHELLEGGALRESWLALLLSDEDVAAIVGQHQPAPSEFWVGRSSKRSLGGLVQDGRLRDYLRQMRCEDPASSAGVHRSPTGFCFAAPAESESPRPNPEVAVALEVAARGLDAELKPLVLRIKELGRELKGLRRDHHIELKAARAKKHLG
jgi:hypothetical protein